MKWLQERDLACAARAARAPGERGGHRVVHPGVACNADGGGGGGGGAGGEAGTGY